MRTVPPFSHATRLIVVSNASSLVLLLRGGNGRSKSGWVLEQISADGLPRVSVETVCAFGGRKAAPERW